MIEADSADLDWCCFGSGVAFGGFARGAERGNAFNHQWIQYPRAINQLERDCRQGGQRGAIGFADVGEFEAR